MKSAVKLGTVALLPLVLLASAACERSSNTPTSPHKWMWASGANTVAQTGVYGTRGTAASDNAPGSRQNAVSWRDAAGKLWLFGGFGYDSTGYRDRLNDLWMFDPTPATWTWISGGEAVDQAGVYGTRGVASPDNVPGARNGAVSWIGADGALWLFGGLGYGAAGAQGHLNDLWKYDPAASDWTWITGSPVPDQAGTYGAKGVAGASNVPGSRLGAVSAVDGQGRLWLFGGFGFDDAGAEGWLDDLWMFDPATGMWTWTSGGNTNGIKGVYGTKGTADAANVPGGRYTSVAWLDAAGAFWLFGGEGLDSAGSRGNLNDLWKFDPAAGQWTWVAGNSLLGQTGAYGTVDIASSTSYPGARYGATAWLGTDGLLWLFGGYGVDSSGVMRWLNDLWGFDPANKNWTWFSGSATGGTRGAYGTKGTADNVYVPGARYGAAPWVDAAGRLWLFGGYGADSAGTGGWLNDLWSFTK
jgi:N-acetylneuraminic acid mutarotase